MRLILLTLYIAAANVVVWSACAGLWMLGHTHPIVGTVALVILIVGCAAMWYDAATME